MTDLLRDLDAYNPELVNTTRLVFIGPCLVAGIAVSGDGAGADCDVYDGQNDKADKKFHLEALSGTTFGVEYHKDVLFRKGIYIAVNAGTTSVMIAYRPVVNQAIKAHT